MADQNGSKPMGIKMIFIVLGAVVGVLLLVFGNSFSPSEREDENKTDADVRQYDEKEYEQELVAKISSICSKIRGAGEVSVAVTLEGSYRALYAQNSQSGITSQGNSNKSEYVLVGSGSNESAVLLGYSPPKIVGVGIVCTGGKNEGVRSEIVSLVAAAFDISTNKIYVTAS